MWMKALPAWLRASLGAATALVGCTAGVAAAISFFSPAPRASNSLAIDPIEAVVTGAGPHDVSYRLENQGTEVIHLGDVIASCGCTVPEPPHPKTLAPGKIATLRVRATPPDVGDKRVTLEVYHDGPGPSPVVATLLLKGRERKLPIVVRQPSEVIVRGRPGEVAPQTLTLLASERAELAPWVLGLDSDNPDLLVEGPVIEEQAGASRSTVQRVYRFTVLTTLRSIGRVNLGFLKIRTASHADGPAPRTITVLSDCKRSIQAVPDTIFAEVRRSELPKVYTVRLLAPSLKARPVISIEAPSAAWLHVDGPVAESGKTAAFAEIRVTIVGTPTNGPLVSDHAQIALKTDAADCPSFDLPVFLRVID